jgi:DNA-binding IclR family transcriptional regulator
MKSDNTKFKRIQCIDRAVDIIGHIARSKQLTMNQISERMGLSVSTVYNIVKTLSSRNYLVNIGGVYQIGTEVGILGTSCDMQTSVPQLVQPILAEINQKTGEMSSVTIMTGTRAEIMSMMENTSEVSAKFTHRIWECPLYLATGRVLVAFGDENAWEKIIREHIKHGMKGPGEDTWNYKKWYSNLDDIRRDGFIILKSRGHIDAVAVPFFSSTGHLMASIGVSVPSVRADDEKLKNILNVVLDTVESKKL